MGERLVEIAPGTWVKPSDVRRVNSYTGRDAVFGRFGRTITPAAKPYVAVKYHDISNETVFECNTYAEARDFADEIAAAVNGEVPPDDPERDDIPEDDARQDVVVHLRPAG